MMPICAECGETLDEDPEERENGHLCDFCAFNKCEMCGSDLGCECGSLVCPMCDMCDCYEY